MHFDQPYLKARVPGIVRTNNHTSLLTKAYV